MYRTIDNVDEMHGKRNTVQLSTMAQRISSHLEKDAFLFEFTCKMFRVNDKQMEEMYMVYATRCSLARRKCMMNVKNEIRRCPCFFSGFEKQALRSEIKKKILV